VVTKDALIGAAKTALAGNKKRPATAAALGAIGATLEAGEPAWWRGAQSAWASRRFTTPDEALLLVWAAIHFEALSGHPLAAQLPACGGAPTGALGEQVRAFLDAPPHGFYASLARRYCGFSSYWNSRWREPAQLFFQKRSLPYYLVELNSTGGLGACVDLLYPLKGFDSRLVEARVALEDPPLDLRRDEDAKWGVACCLPDDILTIRDFAHSARLLRELLGSSEGLLQQAACAPALAPAFVAKNIPVEPEAGLLLVSYAFAEALAPEQRAPAGTAMLQALAPWGERALWVDLEHNEKDYWTIELRLCRPRAGALAWHRFSSQTVTRPEQPKADAAANLAFLA
jgi:hypothetical protein